jgi:Tfp pilus assembly protein PilP
MQQLKGFEMSKYDSLRNLKDASAEQKFAILAMEMVGLLSTIRGYAALLNKAAQTGKIQLPDELKQGVEKIVEAGDDLKTLREILLMNSEE